MTKKRQAFDVVDEAFWKANGNNAADGARFSFNAKLLCATMPPTWDLCVLARDDDLLPLVSAFKAAPTASVSGKLSWILSPVNSRNRSPAVSVAFSALRAADFSGVDCIFFAVVNSAATLLACSQSSATWRGVSELSRLDFSAVSLKSQHKNARTIR